jgi:hypothetical protein
MQSVPITTDVVSSNLDQGEVYNISLSVSCDRSVVYSGSSTKNTDRWNIAEILLKVALSTIKQNKNIFLAINIAVILLTSRSICSSYIMLLLLKLTSPPSSIWNHSQLWLSCLCPMVFLLPMTVRLFGSPVIWLWVHLMKAIPEMRRVR